MNRKFILAAVAALALMFVLGFTRQGAPHAQWEYRTESAPSEKKLNELGAQGWELVAVETSDRVGRNFYFKRSK